MKGNFLTNYMFIFFFQQQIYIIKFICIYDYFYNKEQNRLLFWKNINVLCNRKFYSTCHVDMWNFLKSSSLACYIYIYTLICQQTDNSAAARKKENKREG